jgi:serine O-acetyltransferase
MEYTYDGTAHSDLVASYAADTEPFPTGPATFPERNAPIEEMDVLRELLFPRCWNAGELVESEERVRERIEDLGTLFCQGIQPYSPACLSDVVTPVLDALPTVRERLRTDVEAAYKGDPAAKSYTEVIRSYPGFQAIMVQRVAHRLYETGGPVYARELTEAAKSQTGIDIHPGATIGEQFFIDHGTGVVIGETATVGDWVRIYQDVTLGALHFEEDENDQHALRKGYKRHPDIGDNVVIGAGSKILGPITVGDHVSIGANTWITEDVEDHTTVFVSNHPDQKRKRVEPDTRQ